MKKKQKKSTAPPLDAWPQPPQTDDTAPLVRARGFAQPILEGRILHSGEDAWAHCEGVAAILLSIGAAPPLRAAVYLVYAADHLSNPEDVVAKAFGPTYASLMLNTRKLVVIQRAARQAQVGAAHRALQTERVRKMLLVFSSDLRVVLLRLASRLQTLRFHAQSQHACSQVVAEESLQVFAPLANRLGIWQLKWELEDLAFRFLQPQDYQQVARSLDESRSERDADIEQFRQQLMHALAARGLEAEVHGRSKHIYSIWKKMQGKHLAFAQVFDVRALRLIVPTVEACYGMLSQVHEWFTPVAGEFNDYIARPKPNGYQSLHTVVRDQRARPVEVQIRTREMHHHAELGMAAHWAYKEAGVKGYAGISTTETQARVNEARKLVLRQLLAWERDMVGTPAGVADERIYVFTPQAAVIELSVGSTPIDFAYAVHTSLGHRCRGAKVDGLLVPLSTPLQNGQTVEVSTVKEGGPSMDWLNPQLGFLQSQRARSKVRAWFNAQAQTQTMTRGREAVEKVLQREGKSAIKLDELASALGFADANALFESVGKDEFSLRHIEAHWRASVPSIEVDEPPRFRPRQATTSGQVLIVGVPSLMTHLARCCRPAPPDAIGGFVTRGKGVAVHRRNCSNWGEMSRRAPERLIEASWAPGTQLGTTTLYPVDISVQAVGRVGLLRDISEIFSKEKMNVVSVKTLSPQETRGGATWISFTVEMPDVQRLNDLLAQIGQVAGVLSAQRR